MSLDREELRERCLKLAVSAQMGDPVKLAERFYDFVIGATPKTPRQMIDAALDAADVR